MIRFKALNEEESSCSETEDDTVRAKPTREALEEDAAALYNKALTLLCEGRSGDAGAVLEGLLHSAYLNDEEDRTPMQIQIRRGCLKNLSIIYSKDPEQLESAQRILMDAVQLDPKNVTLWTRLGSVNVKLGNYPDAYFDFQQGLRCSPHHWICIENLVTLSYVLGDYLSCLYYCAFGLEKDSHFVRGAVFRDEILESSPFIAEAGKTAIENWDHLFPKHHYEIVWKTKYLEEAQALINSRRVNLCGSSMSDDSKNVKVPFPVRRLLNFTLVELCELVFHIHDALVLSGNLLLSSSIDLTCCLSEGNEDVVEEDSDVECWKKTENQDETSTSSVFRCRSGSDEKDAAEKPPLAQSNGATDFATFEDFSQSQQSQDAQEPETKKKSRKDVKWWQYEGKRRSQRVRGHLAPVSQSASKSERCFAETLKNLIHPSLLYGEPEKINEVSKQTAEIDTERYFGTQAEIDDVKKFVQTHGKSDVLTVITELALFLCQLTNNKTWPADLVPLYLECCKKYRLYRQEQNEWLTESDSSLQFLKQDALIILSVVEFRLDSSTPSSIEQLKYDKSFVSDLSYLEIVGKNGLERDIIFQIRYCWFRVNYELALAQVGLGKYGYGLHYLKLLENLFQEHLNLSIHLATKGENVVSAEEVRKKIRFVKKMENISRISELHQNQSYDALIEILQLCLTTDDNSTTDLMNRLYLAEAYFHVQKYAECLEQCVRIVTPGLKNRNDQILAGSLRLIEKICGGDKADCMGTIPMKEKRSITNAMIEILTWNENKKSVPEAIMITPWCILHNILFTLEVNDPALYLDEEATPNSVVLLQFAHEFLNRSNKCTTQDGKLLTYTIDVLHRVRDSDEYGSYEETKHCIEQAIFCLYSHPSRKTKIKYLTEHSTTGLDLLWPRCSQLYDYYKPEKMPEFDSYESISSDVESLFQRILSVMPAEMKPSQGDFNRMRLVLEGRLQEVSNELNSKFPADFINIYYLLGDHYFKTKEWTKAVEYYTYDLTVFPYRFDSWAAIALAKGEMISSKLNACEDYRVEDVISNVDVVINCFRRALELEPGNHKIRIEFGSFVYAMFSFCSRLLKQGSESFSMETFEMLETKKDSFLKAAHKCFEPITKTLHNGLTECEGDDDDTQNELWIHHYMLGKILEKLHGDDPEKFLTQYELAAKRIHEQGGMYPAKINYYKPPDLAVEALEIYYRIHASILSFIERHDYDEDKENLLLGFIERAAGGPFMKSKQARSGGGGDNGEGKRKTSEEMRKGQAEIKSLMEDLLKKVEQMVDQESSSSSSSSSDNEDDDGTSVTSSQASTLYSSDEESPTPVDLLPPINIPVMSSFGLSAFQEKMREKEMQDSKNLKAASAAPPENPVLPQVEVEVEKPSVAVVAPKPVPKVMSEAPKMMSEVPKMMSEAPKLSGTVTESKFYKDFGDCKYGRLICLCLIAMEECISRFPQHHKSYFRISHSYATFTQGRWNISKEYLVGNFTTDKKKISGLFADRKANNFFNGVWRNPVDDVDRPGSFPYHMSKTVQHLLEVLLKLSDHHFLAEVGIALSKVPDQDKQYLFNSERIQYSQQALANCVTAAKQFWNSSRDSREAAMSVFETYQKLQKFSPKDNVLAGVLVDCHRQYLEKFGQVLDQNSPYSLEQAFRFFQHLTWASKTNANSGKPNGGGGKNSAAVSSAQSVSIGSELLSMAKQGQLNPTGGPAKVGEGRKKKEGCGKSERQGVKPQGELPTVSLQLSKIGESLREGDARLPKKKKANHGDVRTVATSAAVAAAASKPQRSSVPEAPRNYTKDVFTLSVEKMLKEATVNPEYINPLISDKMISCADPEIMDLSGSLSGSTLKRRGHDSEKDPLALTPPKKSLPVTGDAPVEASREKSQSSMQGSKSTSSKVTILNLPKLTPMPSTGGIPFDLFMNSVNKSAGDAVRSLIDQAINSSKYSAPSAGHQKTTLSVSRVGPTAPVTVVSSASMTGRSTPQAYQKSGPQPALGPQQSNFGERTKKMDSVPDRVTPTFGVGHGKAIPATVSSFLSSRNTSPFRAQSTVVSNPVADSPRHSLSGRSSIDTSGTPPPAHSARKRTPSEWSSGDEPEIIDLTTPPRRQDITIRPIEEITEPKAPQKKITQPEMYFVPRAASSSNYPMPPKKKFQARKRNMSSESSEDPEVFKTSVTEPSAYFFKP